MNLRTEFAEALAAVPDSWPEGWPAEPALMMRTCTAKMTGTHRAGRHFTWPESGPVEAPDWNTEPVCGGGLHGALHGEGDSGLLCWDEDARWLVVLVDATEAVALGGKVKVPRGVVVHVGDRDSASSILVRCYPGRGVIAGTATAGVRGAATAGYAGTATAGVSGTATAGDAGTATAGDAGTATAGDGGTATAGDDGAILIRWWDEKRARWRIAVGYAGEGVAPNVPHKVDSEGRLVHSESGEAVPDPLGDLRARIQGGGRITVGYAGEGVTPNEPHKVDTEGRLVHAESGEAVPDPLGDLRARIQGGGRVTLRAGERIALAEFLRVHR